MSLLTIPRILNFLEPGQQFVVVDDGSLTGDSIARLADLSSSLKVITPEERNDRISQAIANKPNCRKHRAEVPLFFKLIDIPLLAAHESPRFTFTDCDIIYLKGCYPFFKQHRNTYLRTDAIKLSFKLRHGLLKYGWDIPLRFNSGYFSYDTADFDLDFIEYYLGLPDIRHFPYLMEQTGWALLFGKCGRAFSPAVDQFICREGFSGPREDKLAIHLIGGLKAKIKDWCPVGHMPSDGVSPKFELSRNVTLVDWAAKSVHRIYKL